MELEFDLNIKLTNNKIEQYDILLSSHKDWIKYKRDIRINSILEKKRMEFTLELQNTDSIFISSVVVSNITKLNTINNACAVIKQMNFIVYENTLEKLDIRIITLDTYYGKIIKGIIGSNINFILNQYIEDGKVIGFYINSRFK